MATLLHIDSSPMGAYSVSRDLTKEFSRAWAKANPKGKIIYRDLCSVLIPPINGQWIQTNSKPPATRTEEENQLLALSTLFTGELLEADEYVIGMPMHNWGPSSSFKLWADQIVRFGETLTMTPFGPEGTLEKKKATFIIAAGALYGPGNASAPLNFLEPWLKALFGYLGIKQMQFITADGAVDVFNRKIDKATFLAPHLARVRALFSSEVIAH